MTTSGRSNLERLKEAGIIPDDYRSLSKEDESAIEALSTLEVEAIIVCSHKLHERVPDFTERHCGHGMLY